MRSLNRRMYLLGVLVLAVVSTAFAQLGTQNSKFASHEQVVQGRVFKPPTTALYRDADYVTGGVGLRNSLERSIILSGSCKGANPCGSTRDAIVYWSVLGPVTSDDTRVTVTRQFPAPQASVTVTGDEIGVGPDPCWGSDGNHIYRAHLPVSVVTGNGTYLVKFGPKAGGLSNGEDPWDGNTVFPLMEGAAIVAITSGAKFVTVFDDVAGLGLLPSVGHLAYVLTLTVPTLMDDSIKFTTIGADGQVGTSVNADLDVTNEQTFIDNFSPFPLQLAGPNPMNNVATNNDSDWNGNAAAPLPQLFDVTTHGFVDPLGGFTEMHVRYTTAADCTNVVANVVSQFQH